MKRRNMHLGAKPSLFRNAYELRKNPTEAEEILWSYLRDRQIEGVKFRRQHPFSKYVVDFYCHALKYVIEVDGDIHEDAVHQLEDDHKDKDLEAKCILVQRFTNEEVLNDIETVMLQIHETLSMRRKKYLNLEIDNTNEL